MNRKPNSYTPFPAIAIGGPPHSGKSVLIYNLTRALRQKYISHYVLRACPDGEGDFTQETEAKLVQIIRRKGQFSASFVERVAQDIAKRHFPLLVDVGGKPTQEQEIIFAQCTHLILLIADRPGQYEQDLAAWQALANRHHLAIVANLQSSLTAPEQVQSTSSPLKGIINGLERNQQANGPVFQALLNKVAHLFTYSEAELSQHYLSQSPAELALDLEKLVTTLHSPDGRWHPDQLTPLCDYLPNNTDLAAYGRAPNWVYAALAMFTYPNRFGLFDARLGWVELPTLTVAEADPAGVQEGWQITVTTELEITTLSLTTHSHYIDIQDPAGLPLPPLPPAQGLIINGKIPHWLACAVARQIGFNYSWVAIFHPPANGSVIVYTTHPAHSLGDILLFTWPYEPPK